MWRHHLARLQTVGSHLQARRCLCRPLSSAAAGFDSLIAQVSGQLYIDGDYRAAEGGATLAVFAPRDGKPFTELAHASAADVDAAVVSARRCFEDESWSAAAALPRRVAALKQLAAAIREPAMMHSLSTLESMDCGKPYAEAEGDMNACADYCDYFADIAPAALSPDDLETGSDEPFTAQLVKEAVGVVGCVTPWNYPLMQAVLKVVPGAPPPPSPPATRTQSFLTRRTRRITCLGVLSTNPPPPRRSARGRVHGRAQARAQRFAGLPRAREACPGGRGACQAALTVIPETEPLHLFVNLV
jgi:hypothetical protein